MGIIKVCNLKKAYGKIKAVENISFTVRRGEIFGLLGPNGAGKTTTINMLVGLVRPTGGNIAIAGIDAVNNRKEVQRMIGVVPDANNLYGEMSGFENLCFCAALYGLKKTEREKRAKHLLNQFALEQAAHRPFGTYSHGMKRKLTIAAGLIHDPKILFLDEPTTGIDVTSARQIRKLILELKEQGKTVFLTTHYLEEAERICSRVAFIVGGKIVKIDTVAKFRQNAAGVFKIRLRFTGGKNLLSKLADSKTYAIEVLNEDSCLVTSPKPLALAPLLQDLERAGITVYEASQVKPSLEDIFVEITSRGQVAQG
ncbi:MAG TPA: ABC transporter ATP-binding protein [Firmicutes bacterium]|nr:ABC transporter ATP-binding protein [Bacillota bacterium]